MANRLFHIFRNNPQGRETLLQSLYFCKVVETSLIIFIPKHKKFLMCFENNVVSVDLDKSYLTSPETATKHAFELIKKNGITARFLELEDYNTSKIPDIKPNFDFMCCPRSISDLSSKIGLGFIGPRVRHIINSSRSPILLTSPAFKEWQRIAVFLGGSANAVNALKLGLRISRISGFSVDVFTLRKNTTRKSCEKVIENNNLTKETNRRVNKWHLFEKGSFEEYLYQVPHNALAILGASNQSRLKDILFGNKMETIQSTLPNNLLIAGPHYT